MRGVDYTKQRYLPQTNEAAMAVPVGSLGVEALYEALAAGANDAARLSMAGAISRVGRKYSDAARAEAAAISSGSKPLPPIPTYMVKAKKTGA